MCQNVVRRSKLVEGEKFIELYKLRLAQFSHKPIINRWYAVCILAFNVMNLESNSNTTSRVLIVTS